MHFYSPSATFKKMAAIKKVDSFLALCCMYILSTGCDFCGIKQMGGGGGVGGKTGCTKKPTLYIYINK